MKGGVCYTGTFDSPSGYGSAARQFITALHSVGVDVTTELVYQMAERTDYGWTGSLSKHLIDRDIPYKIKILHLTPDYATKYFEKDVYHISHLFWETDRLPKEWIDPCNKMREIWTSSQAMADLFRASGIKVPIYAFPQPVDIAMADKTYGEFIIDGHKAGNFLFYAVFQWIERKNPKGLLLSYWKAFEGRQDVALLLKTYRVTYAKQEVEKIMADIRQWKIESGIRNFPKVILAPNLLTHEQVMKLHSSADCFVTADHGEGWNRPLQEALLMGKPVISTARGGIHEYLSEDYYFPIPSRYVPVVQQSWIPYYTSDQNWAEPDYEKLIHAMRWVYQNREIAKTKGMKAKNFIKDQFGFYKVGLQMRERLEEICRSL